MPTTVAPPSSASAAVRISAAEAVLRSIRTTSGTFGRLPPTVLWTLSPWVRDLVETTTSSFGQEDAGAEHRLVEQAAGVAAQVEDDPFRPFALDLFHRVGERRRGRLR